jgi:hypothetical protein
MWQLKVSKNGQLEVVPDAMPGGDGSINCFRRQDEAGAMDEVGGQRFLATDGTRKESAVGAA